MCGIYAVLKALYTIAKMQEMCMRIKHRGPDSTVCRDSDPNVFLGFHRLAMVDTSETSNQPLHYNGVYLVCNGEIYNHKQLIAEHELKVQTKSDCEVIIHMYLKYGIFKTIVSLNAEFAFVLYDSNKQLVYVSRDQFGVRPLFYGRGNECLISFASEAKSIDYPNSFEPRHYQCIDINNDIIHQFIQWYFFPNLSPSRYLKHSFTEVSNNIYNMLIEEVKDRFMSDRPIGALLSGGVDSSLVAALTAVYYTGQIHFFSVGLEDSEDVKYAKIVVEHLRKFRSDIVHHIITFTVEQGRDAVRRTIYRIESPDVTTIRASVPQMLMSEYIAENTDIKGLFSGEGADELFSGYLYNRLCPNPEALQRNAIDRISNLHKTDCLRTDRTMANGLEVRVPLLGKRLVTYVLSTNPAYRMPYLSKEVYESIGLTADSPKTKMEKLLLRHAFDGREIQYLPDKVLYREKAAFSNAVSSKKKSWYLSLVELISDDITDEELANTHHIYPEMTPKTKEALYYRKIYSEYYPEGLIDKYWMPKWQPETLTDPSATALTCFTSSSHS